MSGVIIDCDCGLHRFDLVFMLALMMQIESTVGEVMSSPAITLTPDKTVLGNLLTIGTHEGEFSSQKFSPRNCASPFRHVYGVLNVVKQQN